MGSDIIIKSEEQIAGIRKACQLAASVLDSLQEQVAPGISTGTIDDWCKQLIEAAGATSAALNYQPAGHQPFPKSVCTSVNHAVCHGIPSHEKQLRDGDIVNVDVTVILDSYYGDASRMYLVGNPDRLARSLCAGAHDCLMNGIDAVIPDKPFSAIGEAIHKHASKCGYSVVKEYCGHGTGIEFHEPPQVLHYRNSRSDHIIRPNMVFTIEPMINAGARHTKLLADGWTVVTKDRSLSAQWEHTVLVTETGAEILTANGKT